MNHPRNNHPMQIPQGRCGQKMQQIDTTLTALNLSAEDYGVLMAARYYFASFAQPEKMSWMTVILACDDFFPQYCDAPRMAQTVLAMVHEIRISRKSTLRFSNPHCLDCANVVTAEERHLVLMLAALRAGDTSPARTHALLLCEGNETDDLLRAAQVLIRQQNDAKDNVATVTLS